MRFMLTSSDSLQKSKLSFRDILQEYPITVQNSHLLTSFLHQLPSPPSATSRSPAPSASSTTTASRRPCTLPSTTWICQSIPSSRRLATCCSRASSPTTSTSTTSSSTNASWRVSRPRLPSGKPSERPRTPSARLPSSPCFRRTSGRDCSSFPRSPAAWKACSTPSRSSSTASRWMASRPTLAPRCLPCGRTCCRSKCSVVKTNQNF